MPRKKIDAVITAVRYLPDGNIETVRLHQRRGAVWSDHVLLERRALVEQLEKGKAIVTGKRTTHMGSTFETGQALCYDNQIISAGQAPGKRDLLTGVPVF